MTRQSCTRRRSPSLFVSFKETDRAPPPSVTIRHRHPWNKYGKEIQPRQRLQVELSSPSREDFARIRNWSIEKRKFEERQAELQRQRLAILEQRQTSSLEATQRARKCAVLEDIQKRQEKREKMQKERTCNHERYLALRRSSRLTPLLHDLRQNAFEQALKRSENVRLELYNTKIKPFRTMRPGQIVSTDVLKKIGKFVEIDEKEIPFEMPAGCVYVQTRSKSLPPRSWTSSKAVPADGIKAVGELESPGHGNAIALNKQKEVAVTQTESTHLERVAGTTASGVEQLHLKREAVSVNVDPVEREAPERLDSKRQAESAYHAQGVQTNKEDVALANNTAGTETDALKEESGKSDNGLRQEPPETKSTDDADLFSEDAELAPPGDNAEDPMQNASASKAEAENEATVDDVEGVALASSNQKFNTNNAIEHSSVS